MRQAVDRGGQRRHLCVDAQRSAEQSHNSVTVSRLEVGEITAAVVYRLIAVAHSGLVHLLEQLVVDAAELLHRVLDLRLVQLRVLLPHLLHDAAPVAQRLAVPLRHASSAVLQHPDVVHRFAQQLHRVRFRDLPLLLHGLGFFRAQVQRPHPLAHLVLQPRGLGLRLVHRRKILGNDRLCQLLVLHDVKDIALHRFAGIENTGFLVLPVVGGLKILVRFLPQLCTLLLLVLRQQLHQPLVLRRGFVDGGDALHVVLLRVKVRQLDLAL